MRILDLFCGGGGAAEGYLRAFPDAEIVGVDIKNHAASYPGQFVQADALEYARLHAESFDLIHASPPCQGYSKHVTSKSSQWVPTKGQDEPRLIEPVRHILQQSGKPYIIENVAGAREHLIDPIMLCGSMFCLPISRHRYFELSKPVEAPPHPRCKGIAKDFAEARGWEYRDMSVTGKGRRKGCADRWREIMDIHHNMTQAEIAESIPPAYTQFLGAKVYG